MYYYYCLVTLGIRPWWKKFVTVFQIIQFTSGAFFTVSFYILYFKDLRVMETNSSYSISFTKGCSGELTSVIRENLLVTATLPHRITYPCLDTPFLRLQSLAANLSCGPTESACLRGLCFTAACCVGAQPAVLGLIRPVSLQSSPSSTCPSSSSSFHSTPRPTRLAENQRRLDCRLIPGN